MSFAFISDLLQKVLEIVDALVGLVFVSQVAAEKVDPEGKAIFDQLIADVLNCLHVGHRGAHGSARVVFALHREDVDAPKAQS